DCNASRIALSASAATATEPSRPKVAAANRRITSMESPGDYDQQKKRRRLTQAIRQGRWLSARLIDPRDLMHTWPQKDKSAHDGPLTRYKRLKKQSEKARPKA